MVNQAQLQATLLLMIASNVSLGVILPPIINLVVRHIQDNNVKKNAAWAICLVVTVVMAGTQGAFTPLVELFNPKTLHGGPAAIITALYQSVLMLSACFGTIVTVASQMFDKFYKPMSAQLKGETDGATSIPDSLANQLAAAAKASQAADLQAANAPGPFDAATVQASATSLLQAASGQAASTNQDVDMSQGSPTLDPGTGPEPT